MSDVTHILSQIEYGDPSAAEQLLPLVYEELRRLAKSRMAEERSDHTLQATALVHDAYVRLVDVEKAQHWNSRGHFFSAAAEAMRRILIELARNKRAEKRGGELRRFELAEDLVHTFERSTDDLLDLNEALEEFSRLAPQVGELVKLRLFAGLNVAESARILGLPSSTAHDNWEFARAWFSCRLNPHR